MEKSIRFYIIYLSYSVKWKKSARFYFYMISKRLYRTYHRGRFLSGSGQLIALFQFFLMENEQPCENNA